MRIAVIGATGVLGRAVLPRLVERGHSVRAIVPSPVPAAHFLRLGIDAVVGDILAPPSLAPALAGCEAALNLAASVPRPGGPRDFVRNDAIRRDGTRHFIAACRSAGMRAPALRWAGDHGSGTIARALPERVASRGLFITAAVA